MGPFISAHLRLHNGSLEAKTRCRQILEPLLGHLKEAGLGSISEIFDGDPPHTPRGCISQAWSVAELLRVWALLR
jgi:glycogen debranching enzyme